MSSILESFKIWEKIPVKLRRKIRLFHSFDDFNGQNVIFVTHDDQAYGIGSNGFAALGLGTRKPLSTPEKIPGLCDLDIQQIATGWAFAAAITGDSEVYSWGNNYSGELGRLDSPT